MASTLIGTSTTDNLICKLWPPAVTFAAELTSEAQFSRGQLLSFDGTGYVAMASGGTPAAVVATDMDESGTIAEAYRSGHFYRSTVEEVSDYELTTADEATARTYNIYFSGDVAEVSTTEETTEETTE